MTLCAAPAYLAKHGTPCTVAELAGHQGIFYATARQAAAWPLPDENGVWKSVVVPHRLRIDDFETILAATLAGAGIARLPYWLLADALENGTLVKVLPELPGPRIELHLAWQQTRHLPSRMRVAITNSQRECPRYSWTPPPRRTEDGGARLPYSVACACITPVCIDHAIHGRRSATIERNAQAASAPKVAKPIW